MTIKVGALCLIVAAPREPRALGRVCEVLTGPVWRKGKHMVRVVGLIAIDGTDEWLAFPSSLRPISDPDADVTERRDDLVYA